MRKILACILLVLGVAGLIIGWLGSTVWAPDAEHTASVSLSDPGVAVVIEPGVMYAGGHEGTLRVESAGDVTAIAATPSDTEAYLADTKYTAITGVPRWGTLDTEVRNESGSATAEGIATSDLWLATSKLDTPGSVSIREWYAQESGKANQQPYRSLILVTDGKSAPATKVTLSWPSDLKNTWVPYAYAAGAVLVILGLVFLLLSLTVKRSVNREFEDAVADPEDGGEPQEMEISSHDTDPKGQPVIADERDSSPEEPTAHDAQTSLEPNPAEADTVLLSPDLAQEDALEQEAPEAESPEAQALGTGSAAEDTDLIPTTQAIAGESDDTAPQDPVENDPVVEENTEEPQVVRPRGRRRALSPDATDPAKTDNLQVGEGQ